MIDLYRIDGTVHDYIDPKIINRIKPSKIQGKGDHLHIYLHDRSMTYSWESLESIKARIALTTPQP